MLISVVKDYTDKPGARYETQGPFSGERFRDEILYPKFKEAIIRKETLTVDLDGGYGYGSSFLEEAFGGLVRKLKKENYENLNDVAGIKVISDDNEAWVNKIKKYIDEAIENPLMEE